MDGVSERTEEEREEAHLEEVNKTRDELKTQHAEGKNYYFSDKCPLNITPFL